MFPTKENTLPNTVAIVVNPLYAQPNQLCKLFGFGRTTVWRYLTEMESLKEYKKASISLNKRLKVVNIKMFEKFLHAQHNKWVRGDCS